MDKQLLKALDNLALGLEALVDALNSKESSKSDTSAALQSGDFGKSLEQISVELKSIKTDTQEILKNQQTIIGLFKQKKDEKKTEEVEGASDPKKQSQIKKGVATILLIAVAVLAIGLAFKLVGNVNILSVLALGIGIVLVAVAFEKVSKITGPTGGPMTIKEAAIVSAIMVIASMGIMVSSWILSKISPLTIPQVLTAATIALLFTFVTPAMSKLIAAMTTTQDVEFKGMRMKTQSMSFGTMLKAAVMLPLLMVSMSIGIMLSSKILSGITPITVPQALTAILIGVMFAVVAKGIAGLITSLTTSQEAKGKGFGFKTQSIGMAKMAAIVLGLPLIMFMIAKGIAWSSHALAGIKPIGFMQALTAILIGAMFAVVSMGMAKLINSLNGVNPAAILLLPVTLVAISLAIALSAKIFAIYKSSFDALGFGTIFKILLMGASISVIAFIMSFAVNKLGKLSIKEVLLLPLFLTTMSLALALSAWIFAKPQFKKSFDSLTYGTIFKILLLGFAMGVVTVIVAIASKFLKDLSLKTVVLLPVLFTLMSLAISVSAWIFAKFKSSFDKLTIGMIFKLLLFGVVTAIVFVAYAIATKIISKILSPVSALKGGLVILILAGVIALSSLILNMGNYKSFPTLKWVLGVSAALGAFAIGSILLGTQILNPLFWLGLPMILTVATTILGVSKILSKGKYDANFGQWAMGVVALYGTFVPIILILGAVGVAAAALSFIFGDSANPFETGRKMLNDVAYSIVDVAAILSKGNYSGGPTKEWAKGISIALGAFAPVYKMLVDSAVLEAFGASAVGPKEFNDAIITVSKGIVTAALFFSKNKSAFLNGPPVAWAKGVGLAIGAFAPVFKTLSENSGWFSDGTESVDAMVYGIKAITRAIIASAQIFAENKVPFESYPSSKWGKGVGAALNAFAPVFKSLSEDTGWFTSGEDVVNQMRYGIVQIAYALTDAALAFSFVKPEMWKSYPSSQWAKGVSAGVEGFMDLFDTMEQRGYSEAFFSIKSKLLEQGVYSMASVARVLWFNKKFFTVKLDENFIKNISKNIIGFARLALQLDGMLVTEKTVTSTSSGFLGIGGSSETKTVRERKDLTLPRDVAIQMSSVAFVLWKNRKFFSFKISSSWVNSLSSSLLGYVSLQKRLEQLTGNDLKSGLLMGLTALNPIAGLVFSGASSLMESQSDDVVAKMTKRLIRIAKLIHSNRRAFETKVDPFFMRKIGQNLIDFTHVTKKIAEIEGKGTTFMGRLGSAMEGALGTDPISQTTRKMVTLAKGYDAMATALIKLGAALRMLKLNDLSELGSITKGLSTGGDIELKKRPSPVKTKELFSVTDKKKRKLSDADEKKNEILYVSKKMDEVVRLLTQIRAHTGSIDNFISSEGNKPKEPIEVKVDVGGKKK